MARATSRRDPNGPTSAPAVGREHVARGEENGFAGGERERRTDGVGARGSAPGGPAQLGEQALRNRLSAASRPFQVA